MGNFKVRVNSEAESKEIQNILESIGFRKWDAWSESGSIGGFIWTDSDMTFCDNKIEYFDESPRKEITLPELRAMVHPMKEYLDKQEDGTYKLISASGGCVDRDWIEVPEGCNVITREYRKDNVVYFHWKSLDSDEFFLKDEKIWSNNFGETLSNFIEKNEGDVVVIWQRTPSLNDQYAEIEQVRQAIKVPCGNDSNHTADAMAYAFMGVGRDKARQHRHYFIDVSDVDEIDFYEIALRYNVTDPCIQHILKKCLAVGQRGQKDFHHDLKDIHDTAKRMLDVHGLDS